jgi:hypothetical protein
LLETAASAVQTYAAETASVHHLFFFAFESYWLGPLPPYLERYLHRDAFRKWHEGYQDGFTQRTSEMIFGTNQFLHANPGAALLSLRCADLPSALESATTWEEHAAKAQQSKAHKMHWEYVGEAWVMLFDVARMFIITGGVGAFPILCQILDLERCIRMFKLVGLTWHSAASLDLQPPGWNWNNEYSCGNQEETVCMFAKLLCVLASPSAVEKAEVRAALPGPDSGATPLRERVLGVVCCIVPSARTMIADAARELGTCM